MSKQSELIRNSKREACRIGIMFERLQEAVDQQEKNAMEITALSGVQSILPSEYFRASNKLHEILNGPKIREALSALQKSANELQEESKEEVWIVKGGKEPTKKTARMRKPSSRLARDVLPKMTVPQLKQFARNELEIELPSRYKKNEIVDHLQGLYEK